MPKEISTVHLIGLGAVGSAYASLFFKWNRHCIKVVLDEERLPAYQKGTRINGESFNFDLTVPKKGDPKAELILVVVKGHHLSRAIEVISPLVGEDTIILSLLNGITSEEYLSQAFGRDKVLHGFVVGTDAGRSLGEAHFSTPGKIVFGEHYAEAVGKSATVAAFFSRASIPYVIPENIRREMWWKFMMNAGVNQTSAILRSPYGDYQNIPEARELMAAACREVIPLAQREGIHLSVADIDEYLRIFTNLSPQGKTSMLQDIEAGRKTEVESFGLAVMNLGKKHGIPTPVNETLYRMIKVLESRSLKA